MTIQRNGPLKAPVFLVLDDGVHCVHMATRRVGIRELRENLSRLVRRVERGEVLEVTDRGRAVARLVPVGAVAGSLTDLVLAGQVRPARPRGSLPQPLDLPSRMTSEEAVDLLRGDG